MAKKKKGGKHKGQRPPSVCKAILLCDSVSVDDDTDLADISGVFSKLSIEGFPGPIPTFVVFLQLTNGVGRYQLTVEVHDLHDGEALFRIETFVDFFDKLNAQIFAIPISLLSLRRPGAYDVIVLADGQEIDRQQFIAIEREGIGNGFEQTEP
ncbi:MAG TPA: hypothetical protein VGZ47_20030 [Gemmataceae bacterium]|jgi:hypothetical protein|nr:hypothetical protein [Gemmataceae bacterium]